MFYFCGVVSSYQNIYLLQIEDFVASKKYMYGGSSRFDRTVLFMYKWANLKPLEGLTWSVLSLTVFLRNVVRLFLVSCWGDNYAADGTGISSS